MKHELDVKITKNSEEKTNEFSAQDFLDKIEFEKADNTNQKKKDKGNIVSKISWWSIGITVMIAIVFLNLLIDIFNRCSCFKISTQTNVLTVLLAILLIIRDMFPNNK